MVKAELTVLRKSLNAKTWKVNKRKSKIEGFLTHLSQPEFVLDKDGFIRRYTEKFVYPEEQGGIRVFPIFSTGEIMESCDYIMHPFSVLTIEGIYVAAVNSETSITTFFDRLEGAKEVEKLGDKKSEEQFYREALYAYLMTRGIGDIKYEEASRGAVRWILVQSIELGVPLSEGVKRRLSDIISEI